MDVKELITELRSAVEGARSLPISASAVINRTEVLELVARLEASIPDASANSAQGSSERAGVVGDAQHRAEDIIRDAERERDRLVSESETFRFAKTAAERERAQARQESEAMRKDTDEYVDSRLANFEVTLQKTLEAVSRGRRRLQGRSDFHQLAADPDRPAGEDLDPHAGAAEPSAAMGQLRARADRAAGLAGP